MAHPTKPAYYRRGSIQVWDFIRDQSLNFHLGNAIKYICRYGHKGNYDDQVSDLKKAIHYLNDELNNLQRSRNIEDLPGLPQDTIVFSGTGVPGGLSADTISFSSSSYNAAEPYNGGVEGGFGGGSDFISYGSDK